MVLPNNAKKTKLYDANLAAHIKTIFLVNKCCAHVLIEWFGNTPGANKGDWLQKKRARNSNLKFSFLTPAQFSTKRVDQVDVYSQQK